MSDQKRPRPLDSLAQRLLKARGRMTRERAATALGISPATLKRIERGDRPATVSEVVRAAALYGADAHWLLFGEAAPDPALERFGPDLAELLRTFMRDRFGVSRIDQLTDAQRREVNDQAERLVALVRLEARDREAG